MAGRSCSLARRVFFEAIAVPDQPARERGRRHHNTAPGTFGGQLRHGDVGHLGHAGHQKIPVRVELGVAPAPFRFRRQATGLPVSRHQLDDKGHRNVKMGRRRAPGVPGLDKAANPLSQIEGIGFRHRTSPPPEVNHETSPTKTP
jgi:hypothetical protein